MDRLLHFGCRPRTRRLQDILRAPAVRHAWPDNALQKLHSVPVLALPSGFAQRHAERPLQLSKLIRCDSTTTGKFDKFARRHGDDGTGLSRITVWKCCKALAVPWAVAYAIISSQSCLLPGGVDGPDHANGQKDLFMGRFGGPRARLVLLQRGGRRGSAGVLPHSCRLGLWRPVPLLS